jgi:hypothetical protein
MVMVNYNDGNWHGWNGGECPVHPETVVEYVWNGSHGLVSQTEKAGWGIGWRSTGKYHMIAFRVIKEHREPREFWVAPHPVKELGVISVDERHPNAIKVREVIE